MQLGYSLSGVSDAASVFFKCGAVKSKWKRSLSFWYNVAAVSTTDHTGKSVEISERHTGLRWWVSMGAMKQNKSEKSEIPVLPWSRVIIELDALACFGLDLSKRTKILVEQIGQRKR